MFGVFVLLLPSDSSMTSIIGGLVLAFGALTGTWVEFLELDLRGRRWTHQQGVSWAPSRKEGRLDESTTLEIMRLEFNPYEDGEIEPPLGRRKKVVWPIGIRLPHDVVTIDTGRTEGVGYVRWNHWADRLGLPAAEVHLPSVDEAAQGGEFQPERVDQASDQQAGAGWRNSAIWPGPLPSRSRLDLDEADGVQCIALPWESPWWRIYAVIVLGFGIGCALLILAAPLAFEPRADDRWVWVAAGLAWLAACYFLFTMTLKGQRRLRLRASARHLHFELVRFRKTLDDLALPKDDIIDIDLERSPQQVTVRTRKRLFRLATDLDLADQRWLVAALRAMVAGQLRRAANRP